MFIFSLKQDPNQKNECVAYFFLTKICKFILYSKNEFSKYFLNLTKTIINYFSKIVRDQSRVAGDQAKHENKPWN